MSASTESMEGNRTPAPHLRGWRSRDRRYWRVPGLRPSGRNRPVRPEEGTYLAYRQRNSLLRFLPREHAHFGIGCEHRSFHGDGIWMRWDIIGQDQYRRPAIAHEIPRHG